MRLTIIIVNFVVCLNKCIFSKDVGISVVFALSLFAGATASAAYASDVADEHDTLEDRRFCNGGDVREDFCNDVETVRDSEGATAVRLYCSINTVYKAKLYTNIPTIELG